MFLSCILSYDDPAARIISRKEWIEYNDINKELKYIRGKKIFVPLDIFFQRPLYEPIVKFSWYLNNDLDISQPMIETVYVENSRMVVNARTVTNFTIYGSRNVEKY